MRKITLLLASLAFADSSGAETLQVSEARASQRAGTKLVDISYDVTGGTPPYTVSIQGSLDGGQTWTLPINTVSGNVGTVSPGNNHLITWNATADWNGQVSEKIRFRVTASDSAVPPVPDGFVLIPEGYFQTGDDRREGSSSVGRFYEEPIRSIFVSAFYMAKYEVTKELWDEVRSWATENGYSDLDLGMGKYPNHPVYYVNWWSAVKWCNARSEKEGLTPIYRNSNGTVFITGTSPPIPDWNAVGYRLPTEAEWEKAARGGLTGKRFPWGDTISHSQSNYFAGGYSYDVSQTQGYHPSYNDGVMPLTAPVGIFSPNGYGLFDMAGNVAEWCWDIFSWYPNTSESDPKGPNSGSDRVMRGGDWMLTSGGATGCRVTRRAPVHPSRGFDAYPGDSGFRIALSLMPQK